MAFGSWLWETDWEALPRLEFRRVFLMPKIYLTSTFRIRVDVRIRVEVRVEV